MTLPGTKVDPEHIAAGGQQTYDFEGAPPVQMATSPPLTPDGRIHLTPPVLGAEPYRWLPPDEDWPLALVSPAGARLTNSTFGESNLRRLQVTLHPAEAAARGLAAGDRVRVVNQRGEVHCHLATSAALRAGVAAMPKGAWARSSLNGLTSTALCPDDGQVVGGAACFNDARVEVERLSCLAKKPAPLELAAAVGGALDAAGREAYGPRRLDVGRRVVEEEDLARRQPQLAADVLVRLRSGLSRPVS